MIPVFQRRNYVSGEEGLGDCLEACIASILELPLTAVPDRNRLLSAETRVALAGAINADATLEQIERIPGYDTVLAGIEDLRRWLARRGIGVVEHDLETRRQFERFADRMGREHRGYWIGIHYVQGLAATHATVWRGSGCVHNPARGVLETELLDLDRPVGAWLLTAADPARIARSLNPLPAIATAGVSDYPPGSYGALADDMDARLAALERDARGLLGWRTRRRARRLRAELAANRRAVNERALAEVARMLLS